MSKWTKQQPEDGMAYLFWVPTGGIGPDGQLAYRDMPSGPNARTFSGNNWSAAVEFGILRFEQGKAVPGQAAFSFPDSVYTGDEDHDRLIDAYRTRLAESKLTVPNLSDDERRVWAAQRASEDVGTTEQSP